jgi:peptide/nickel transport system ATP-binding protein
LISHSLPVVAQLATRVAVMQTGRFVEIGTADQVLGSPQHPYTQTLLAAVPPLPA